MAAIWRGKRPYWIYVAGAVAPTESGARGNVVARTDLRLQRMRQELQHNGVEALGLLHIDHVGGIGKYHFLGAGHPLSEHVHRVNRPGEVEAAKDNQGGCVDISKAPDSRRNHALRLKLLGMQAVVVRDHRAQPLSRVHARAANWMVRPVSPDMHAPLDHSVNIMALFHLVIFTEDLHLRIGCWSLVTTNAARHDDQRVHQLLMLQCKIERQRPAIGESKDGRPRDAKMREQIHDVLPVRKHGGIGHRLAETALIQADDAILSRKSGELLVPHAAIGDIRMQQHEWVARARHFIVKPPARHIEIACLRCYRLTHHVSSLIAERTVCRFRVISSISGNAVMIGPDAGWVGYQLPPYQRSVVS